MIMIISNYSAQYCLRRPCRGPNFWKVW